MSPECQLLHFWGEMLIGLFIKCEATMLRNTYTQYKYIIYWPKIFLKIISDISYDCLKKIPQNWPWSFHQIFSEIAAKIVPKLDLEVFMSKSLTTKPPICSCIIYYLQLICHSFRPPWLLKYVLTIVIKKWNKDHNFINLFSFLLWLNQPFCDKSPHGLGSNFLT